MSTILDALRKVEEEKRTKETDVRTRLLSNSARFDFRTPRRSRFPWVVASGLVFAGIALGAGLMLWRAPDAAPVAEVVPPSTSLSPVASAPPAVSPPGQSQSGTRSKEEMSGRQSPQVQPGTPEVGSMAPAEKPFLAVPPSSARSAQVTPSGSAPIIGETMPRYDPWGGGNPQKITGSASDRQGTEALHRSSEVVQKSPFVSSPPYDHIVAPPPLPPPTERRVTAASKPPRPSQSTPEKSGPATPKAPVAAIGPSSHSPTPVPTREEPLEAPPGASLSFLQWSADPEKRVASIKVGTGPSTLAHEGDSIDGMTVVKIHPDAVELRSGESRYLLKAR